MSLSYAEIVIQSPPARVFDFCADLRNELIWNPNAKHVELLTMSRSALEPGFGHAGPMLGK